MKIKVEHEETGGTPTRFEVRKSLAEALNAKLELVYVKMVETRTGTNTALGEANIYESVKQAKLVEPKYIITRNAPPAEKPKQEEVSE
jgi:small subunit ribosomal protein S24e